MKVLKVSGCDYAAMSFEEKFKGKSVDGLIDDIANVRKELGDDDNLEDPDDLELVVEEIPLTERGFEWMKNHLIDLDEDQTKHHFIYGEGEIIGEGFKVEKYRVLCVTGEEYAAAEFSELFEDVPVVEIMNKLEDYQKSFTIEGNDGADVSIMEELYTTKEFDNFFDNNVDVETRKDTFYWIETSKLFRSY